MKEPELEEEALRATSQGDELSIERQSLKDQIPPVRVFAPSGKEITVTLETGASRAFRARTSRSRNSGFTG